MSGAGIGQPSSMRNWGVIVECFENCGKSREPWCHQEACGQFSVVRCRVPGGVVGDYVSELFKGFSASIFKLLER